MTGTLAIRPMDPDDRDFVIDALIDLQRVEQSLHSSRQSATAEFGMGYFEDICRSVAEKNGGILVATVDGAPVGLVSFWIETNHSLIETDDSNRCGYVSDLYVVPAHRGSGVAMRLLREAERGLAEDKALRRIRICALAANAPALSAYGRAGFEPYEIAYEKLLDR